MLEAYRLLKDVTIQALRDSAGKSAGEHLHLERPETKPLISVGQTEIDTQPDPFKTRPARLQQLMAELREHGYESAHALDEIVEDVVQAIIAKDTDMAAEHMGDLLEETGHLLTLFRMMESGEAPHRRVQREEFNRTIFTGLTELFQEKIEFAAMTGRLEEQDVSRFNETLAGLIDLFFKEAPDRSLGH